MLVVKDDASTRESLIAMLEEAGHIVHSVIDCLAALEYLRHRPRPGVILLDLRRPWLDGWEFREQQRQDPVMARIPVVVLSSTALTVREAQRLDAAGYFVKPYDEELLLELVAELCRNAR